MTPAIYKEKSCRTADRKSAGHCGGYPECIAHDLLWTEQKCSVQRKSPRTPDQYS